MTDPRTELREIVNQLRARVVADGARALRAPRGAANPQRPKGKAVAPSLGRPAAPPAEPSPAAPTNVLAGFQDDPALSRAERLERLRAHIGDCRRCPLGASRIKLAFGVGNPNARVVFVGEGPGYAEDRQGEPFVGPAGQLLDKILTATGLSRQPTVPADRWVYIANVVKCHPMIDPTDNTKRGNDRPPTPEEMSVCAPFLMAQIRIIRPAFLVPLGNTAGKALLKTEEGISKFRGRWRDFSPPDGGPTIRLLPTYHPAALLRNPNLKKDVWEDMKLLKAALDAPV